MTLAKRYGKQFPEPKLWKDGKAWKKWIECQRKEQESVAKDKRMHYARHRNFRVGNQWISTRDGRTWREPNADENDIRIVDNQIGPALDFRLAIVAEQRPGFRHEPFGFNIESKEAAEAQQAVSEYYFHSLNAWNTFLDAAYNSQTDGAAFVHIFIDPKAGPRIEDVEVIAPTDERYANLIANGYEPDEMGNVTVGLDEGGQPLPNEAETRELPLGDINHRVVLAHEVFFNHEAKSINGPVDKATWCAIRRLRSVEEARLETGQDDLEGDTALVSEADPLDKSIERAGDYSRGLPPFPVKRSGMKDGIIEYLIFIAPDPDTPELVNGHWVRIVGDKIVEQSEGEGLPGGLIPLARFSDGSPDPQILPRPVMSDWIGDQMAINALKSLLMKHTRFFAGGRLLMQKNTLIEETYSSIVGSLVEYNGIKPEPMAQIAAGQDAYNLLSIFTKTLEDKTGYNDLARGRVSESGSLQDVSGRALLGARELFERTFGPFVRATANGGTEWAKIIVAYAKYLFETPRLIPMVSGRGDLAKRISSDMLGSRPLVYVDPETMMPMPRAWRHQVLFESYKEGLISLQEYQQRAPYAEVRNVHMGQLDHWSRAQWINTVLLERWQEFVDLSPEELYSGANLPILWQDDPAIHMKALDELILDERKQWPMRRLAAARHNIYEHLVQAKMNPMIMVPMEVIGAPPERQIPVMMNPMQGGPSGGTGMPPGTPPTGTMLTTPEMSGAQPASAQPLGNFGAVEQ